MAIAIQFFAGIPGLLGVIFLIIGIAGEIRAKRFNKRDWALADALHEALDELGRARRPPRTGSAKVTRRSATPG